MKNIIILSFCLFFFSGCDEIMPVIPDPPPPGDKVVLMEEFSGGDCTPCSTAAQLIREISAQYGVNFIPVTIHTNSGGTADPVSGAKYDFRTAKGDELQQFLGGANGIPAGVIDRKVFEGETGLQHFQNKWAGLVQKAIAEPSVLNINLNTDYDPSSRKLDMEFTMVPQTELTGDLRLVVLVNESHLIDLQSTPEGIDPDYEHNHILRDVLTPITGDVMGNQFDAQSVITKSISYVIPQDDQDWWKPENMEVVAFVVNHVDDSVEVLQATAAHFTE